MPTELPPRRAALPESTPEGRLFTAVAVLAMLVIGAILIAHPNAFASSAWN